MNILRYKRLFLIPILGVLLVYCYSTKKEKEIINISNTFQAEDYTITVERGAFHYDTFILKNDTIVYLPDDTSLHSQEKYNSISKKMLEKSEITDFLKNIEEKGFWTLKDSYTTGSSCTSNLIVTIETNQKSKTVICDDFSRGCPEAIKYIDKKIIEFEGNNLKRIYLPG